MFECGAPAVEILVCISTRSHIRKCGSVQWEIGQPTLLHFIKDVDEILDAYHEDYIKPENDKGDSENAITSIVNILGIYVGEVIKRNHVEDAIWQNTEFGLALVKNENQVNPIAKAHKHIVNGKENGDDIRSFFNVAILLLQGKIPTQNNEQLKIILQERIIAITGFILHLHE